MVNEMNTKAVSIIRYTVGIVKWTKDDLRKLGGKTRKLLTTYNTTPSIKTEDNVVLVEMVEEKSDISTQKRWRNVADNITYKKSRRLPSAMF